MKNSLLPEELENFKAIAKEYNTTLMQYGNIEKSLNDLKDQKDDIYKQLKVLDKSSQDFVSVLTNKYGSINIDINTGLYTKVDDTDGPKI